MPAATTTSTTQTTSTPPPPPTLVMYGNHATPLENNNNNKPLSNAEFLEGCATVLASAFSTDPLFAWALEPVPQELREQEWLPMWRSLVAIRANDPSPSLGLYLALEQESNAPSAASIWYPPGLELGVWDLFRTGVFSCFYRMGWTSLNRLYSLIEQIEEKHKKLMPGPHAYLLAIGVDQSATGRGYGSVFARQVLKIVDEAGDLPCYLENSNPRNIPFYQRLGFEIVEEIKACGEGPPLFIMIRPPTPSSSLPPSLPLPVSSSTSSSSLSLSPRKDESSSSSSSAPAPSSSSSSRPRPQVVGLPDHAKYVVDLREKAEQAKNTTSVGQWAVTTALGLGIVYGVACLPKMKVF